VAVGDLVFGSSDFAAQPSAGVADFVILNLWFAVPTGLDAVHAAVLPMVLQTGALDPRPHGRENRVTTSRASRTDYPRRNRSPGVWGTRLTTTCSSSSGRA
jgi:hypothetical protein